MKVAIIPWSSEYEKDKIFAIDDAEINKDHRLNAYYIMQKEFIQKGDELHTVDMYEQLDEVSYFLFFEYNKNWIIRLWKKGLSNRTVYCNGEPEVVNPNNCAEGYIKIKRYFSYILTWNDDLVDNKRIFKRINPYYVELNLGNVPYNKRQLLTNISGNKTSTHSKELYSERLRVIEFFERNYPDQFKFYGVGWDGKEHSCYGGCPETKAEIYHNFKFALSLENMKAVKGYVTEKILDCLTMGIVPIYAGAVNITEYVPAECFINYNQFDDLEKMAQFLIDMPEETYNKYLDAAKRFIESGALQKKLSGSVYAENIYSLIHKGNYHKNFCIKKKDIMYLQLQIFKSEQVIKIKKMIKNLRRSGKSK